MSVNPDDLGRLEGEGGESGTLTPSGADPQARIRELEQENHALREDKRAERARALGAELHLAPTQVELLKLVPADQMQEKATALAEEMKQPAPAAPAPPPVGDAPPAPAPPAAAGDPPLVEVLGALDGSQGGNPLPDPSLSWQDEMDRRVAAAKDLAEIAAIQQEYKQRQNATG